MSQYLFFHPPRLRYCVTAAWADYPRPLYGGTCDLLYCRIFTKVEENKAVGWLPQETWLMELREFSQPSCRRFPTLIVKCSFHLENCLRKSFLRMGHYWFYDAKAEAEDLKEKYNLIIWSWRNFEGLLMIWPILVKYITVREKLNQMGLIHAKNVELFCTCNWELNPC